LACAVHGAWFVPVDPASSERDLREQIRRVRPSLGFCGDERESTYRPAATSEAIPYVSLPETSADEAVIGERTPPGTASDIEPSTRLAVLFTSGTTSQPKGVVLTQANYSHVAATMSSIVDLRAEHRWYVTLPLFHANAQYYCIAPAIATGASVALNFRFSASGWVQDAVTLGVTHASLFAAPIRMILARTPADAPALALKHVWFAQNLGREHYSRFAEIVGVRPRQLYGMTETIAIVTADDPRDPRHDVIGQAVGGRSVRLVDPTTAVEPSVGEPGVIHVAGTRGTDLFVEYLHDADTTDLSFYVDRGGRTWLRTGDLAVDTGRGVLRFVGRADDVIKVAGENVSLTEVEAALAQAPGVLEVAVLAVPDPVRDVVPVAYVVARDPSAPPEPHTLERWASQNLPPASRPRAWHVIDALPRTSVGKVRRFVIAQQRTGHEDQR
jgi:crotonobetaine/carnitine-CoA ligase